MQNTSRIVPLGALTVAFLCTLSTLPASAQRLLWEQSFASPNVRYSEVSAAIALASNQRFLLTGTYNLLPLPSGAGCSPTGRAYYRSYGLTGTLISEKLGRGVATGNNGYASTGMGAGWVVVNADRCVGTQRVPRPLIQRLTLAGDTGRAWYPVPATPAATAVALLAQGNKLLTAGWVVPTGLPGQIQQFQFTCSDTLGRVRWVRNYPRLPLAADYATTLVPTPRGGYLLSGDAYRFAVLGYDHYVLETDSAGLFRRARILQPLGPGYDHGSRLDTQCNALALPNAGGYLLSGIADSVDAATIHHRVGYVMRLDTALNVTWVYRHPPALSGTGATQDYAYRLRLLPNNTVGLLLTEVRGPGTPDLFLAQVDVATGWRVGFYALSSNTQAVVIPTDWQWVGDGTLLVCGQARLAGATYLRSYVARWDFRGTPLATRAAGEATAPATFTLYPNPSTGPFTLVWSLPAPARAGQVRFYSLLGQLLHTQALPPTASGRVAVAGLPPGRYLARLLDAAGAGQGRALRVVVQ